MQDLMIRVSGTPLIYPSLYLTLFECERLSAETGCWLYLSGQHVNASMGFYNYSSPRVRREARPQVAAIQALSLTMYNSLLNARRADAVALNLQVEQGKDELHKTRQELAEKDACIAQLQAQLLTLSNNT